MNAFQTCRNTTDAVPLYLPQQLFLKPMAKLNISLQLPNIKKQQTTISHWEIMEKLRLLIKPDEFSVLKVTKTSVEFVRFEAELDNKSRLEKVLSKLDNNSIKLKDFPEPVRLKASKAKSDFPTRYTWDTFFHESKDMDDMRPGERPDTVHISNLPIKWFVPYHLSREDDIIPSEKLFYRIFEKFGAIRYVDIPVCDPYRKKMKDHISGLKIHSFDDKDVFEGYVQFKDYIGFTKTMDALRDMKLLRKEDDEAFCANIRVDFDRSKHLSDASVRRREIVRDRLVKKQKEREEKEKNELDAKKNKEHSERQKQIDLKNEKEKRRKEREEKRKAKILEKLKIKGCDEINEKIAKEEKKLLKVQRKLEAIRVVEELFKRINDKKDVIGHNLYDKIKKTSSGTDELQKFKNTSELEVISQRQKLHSAIEGRIVLKNILAGTNKPRSYSSSSSDSSSVKSDERGKDKRSSSPFNNNNNNNNDIPFDSNWYGYPPYIPPAALYPPQMRTHPAEYLMYPNRGGRHQRFPAPGPSRGYYPRRSRGYRPRYRGGGFRGNLNHHYPPEVEEEYLKYFSKFLNEHKNKNYRNSRSESRSRSKSRRSSRSRSRSRSYSRSRSRSRRSRSSRSRKSHSRSRSGVNDRRSSSRRQSNRSRSYHTPSPPPSRSRRKSRSKSRTRSKSRSRRHSKTRSRSRSRSVDSSKFVSRSELKSKSWSSPRSVDKDKAWSKSPEVMD